MMANGYFNGREGMSGTTNDQSRHAIGFRWEYRSSTAFFPSLSSDSPGSFFLPYLLLCPALSLPEILADFNLFARPPSLLVPHYIRRRPRLEMTVICGTYVLAAIGIGSAAASVEVTREGEE